MSYKYINILFVFIIIVLSYYIGHNTTKNNIIRCETPIYVINKQHNNDEFSQEALVKMIKDLGIKYPEIVLAQSILETGHWTSNVFKENYNLFGMRQARSRIRTAKGTQLNHAYYDNWKESLYDYAFYQARYLNHKIKSEQEYFAALDSSYAESSNYSNTLKHIIKKENLKTLFE